MSEPEKKPAPGRPASGERGSELEHALEELNLEPGMEELDPNSAEQVRGGGLMGYMPNVVKKTPLF